MGLHTESIIKEKVSDSFKENSIDNPKLEKAVTEAFINILTNRQVIKELSETITEFQTFDRNRRNQFR